MIAVTGAKRRLLFLEYSDQLTLHGVHETRYQIHDLRFSRSRIAPGGGLREMEKSRTEPKKGRSCREVFIDRIPLETLSIATFIL